MKDSVIVTNQLDELKEMVEKYLAIFYDPDSHLNAFEFIEAFENEYNKWKKENGQA